MDGLEPEQRELLKDHSVTQPFESKIRHLLDEETEQEDEDKLAQVMRDLAEFNQKNELDA